MIKYGTYTNSPECYWVSYPKSDNELIHVHISEIRRFFGVTPATKILFSAHELLEFFTYRLKLEGEMGEYRKKKAQSQARITHKRPRGKPNSPGEGKQ